jgi:hypothetical protein
MATGVGKVPIDEIGCAGSIFLESRGGLDIYGDRGIK